MAKSTRKYTESFKDLHLEDDYEDFGYEVQNQKRYSTRNKRQSKFKDYDEHSDWDWIIFGRLYASFFIHFPLYIILCLVGWHLDSSRSGTEGLVEGSGGVILSESSGIKPMDNYFNTKIIERHEDHLDLNNVMAEFSSFMLSLEGILTEPDKAWWADQKKSFICYDVWQLTLLGSVAMPSPC